MMRHFLLLVITLSCSHLFGTNYYVAKDGANSNPGTEAAPFLTIAKASSVLQAGDTCFIKAGVYREELKPTRNGTANSPIVYTHYQNDSVVVSATEPLTSWTVYQGDIYQASYDMDLEGRNMVYVNGKPMDWARWPNNTDHDPYTVEAISVSGGSASTLESSALTSQNWANGYVWYLAAHSGTSWTRQVTGSQSNSVSFEAVDINRWPFNPHNPTVFRNNNRGQFYLFGLLSALDYPEEWHYDEASDIVYLQAPNNADPNSLNVEVAERARTIFLDNTYIHIDGINAFGGNVEIKKQGCVVRNGTFTECLNSIDDLDNTSAQVGIGAIHVRAANTVVEHNTIDGSSLSGVFIQGWNNVENVIIQFNLIKNTDKVGIHASPIRCNSSNTRLLSNTIHTTARDGIYCSGFNNEIAYNDVSDCMKMNNDGGIFYTVGTDVDRNHEIHHNWFHDSQGPEYADGRAAGIYLDNDSKGFLVHHNVVWNISWSGIQMNWDIWDNDLYHNTLWNVERAMGTWLKPEHTMQRIKVYNNLSNEIEWIGTDIQENSPFRDLAAADFVPRAISTPVDAGRVIMGVNEGFQGANPDIGAYESGLSPWIPGVNTELGGEITTSIRPAESISQLALYPNPLKAGKLVIQTAGQLDKKQISITDVAGRLVYQTESQQEELIVPSNVFNTPGMYWVMLSGETGMITHKLWVE